jgi:hypothetical protein
MMLDHELPDYAKVVITVFCAGCAIITIAAVYQYGTQALYVPGIATVIVSLMIWTMVVDITKRGDV